MSPGGFLSAHPAMTFSISGSPFNRIVQMSAETSRDSLFSTKENPTMKVFSSVPRIISGLGCIDALGDEVRRMACQKALIVCDGKIEPLGLLTPLLDSLNRVKGVIMLRV